MKSFLYLPKNFGNPPLFPPTSTTGYCKRFFFAKYIIGMLQFLTKNKSLEFLRPFSIPSESCKIKNKYRRTMLRYYILIHPSEKISFEYDLPTFKY